MADEKHLQVWVSDQLHTLLGYSQPAVVSFIIGLAKKSSSVGDIVSQLLEYGLPSSLETQSFADELYRKVPRKMAGLNAYQQAEREAAAFARKQKDYTLLDADDDDEEVATVAEPVQSTKNSRQKHLRRKRGPNENDEEDEVSVRPTKGRRGGKSASDEDDEDEEASLNSVAQKGVSFQFIFVAVKACNVLQPPRASSSYQELVAYLLQVPEDCSCL
eukprot:Gb_40352 [translate_table: standard]